MSPRTAAPVVLATTALLGALAVPAAAHPSFPASAAFGFAPNTQGGTGAEGRTPPYAAGTTVTLQLKAPIEQVTPFQGAVDSNVVVTLVVPREFTSPACGPARTIVNTPATSGTDQPGSEVAGWTCAVTGPETQRVVTWSGPQVAIGKTLDDAAQFFALTARTPTPARQTTYDGTGGTEGFVLTQEYASGLEEFWIPSEGYPAPAPAGSVTRVATGLVRTVAADCGTGTTPQATYVQHVFRTVLDRCAEPTAQAHFAARLTSGALAPSAFARGVLLTDENLSDEVARTYEALVGRTPGSAEAGHWVRTARTTRDVARLELALLASQELYLTAVQPGEDCAAVTGTSAPSRERWLDVAYCTLAGRLPDPAGKAHWLRVLGAGTDAAVRRSVATRISRSPEGAQRRAALAYEAYVGRAATGAERTAGGTRLAAIGHQTLLLDAEVLASDAAYAAAQE